MSANSMITSVRNNLNQLSSRKKLRNRLGGINFKKNTEYNFPKATTKQLKDLRKRLKEEQKSRMLKVVSLTIVLFVLLFWVVIDASNGIAELLTSY